MSSDSLSSTLGRGGRWLLLLALLFGVILLPFFLYEASITQWVERMIHPTALPLGWIVLVLGGLLALDILLPVPSSLVSTSAGFLLGFWGGLVTSFIGMTLGCLLGYGLGRHAGRPLAGRLIGAEQLGQLEQLRQRRGDAVLVVARPIPMLAEASVLLAGISRMELQRFLTLTALANLGISLVYAALGALSATTHSFLLAFVGAILIPLLATRLQRPPHPDR